MENPGCRRRLLILNLFFLLYQNGCSLDDICSGFPRNSITIKFTIQMGTTFRGKGALFIIVLGQTGKNLDQLGKPGIVILTNMGKIQNVAKSLLQSTTHTTMCVRNMSQPDKQKVVGWMRVTEPLMCPKEPYLTEHGQGQFSQWSHAK